MSANSEGMDVVRVLQPGKPASPIGYYAVWLDIKST